MMDSGFDLLHEPFSLMKAPDIRPQSLVQAYRILAVNAGAAMSLASGQNLPAGLQESGENCLRALVRHCELLQSGLALSRPVLLTEATAHVGHRTVRNRGALGGSREGNLQNGTMEDYLLPIANGVADIHVSHVDTPEVSTALGAKGVGEAGLIGAMGAVWIAVNDALKPFGAKVLHQPFTPKRILDALARATTSKQKMHRFSRRADLLWSM
jgi:hypothetical protein